MTEKRLFEREMDAFAATHGRATERRNYCVLRRVVRWLSQHGHGDLRLSAIKHRLSDKFRADSVITAAVAPFDKAVKGNS